MIGEVVTGCVAILPYHTATQDRGSECRDFGFISRIVTALAYIVYYYICSPICAYILYSDAAKFSIKQFSFIYLTVSVVRQR